MGGHLHPWQGWPAPDAPAHAVCRAAELRGVGGPSNAAHPVTGADAEPPRPWRRLTFLGVDRTCCRQGWARRRHVASHQHIKRYRLGVAERAGDGGDHAPAGGASGCDLAGTNRRSSLASWLPNPIADILVNSSSCIGSRVTTMRTSSPAGQNSTLIVLS